MHDDLRLMFILVKVVGLAKYDLKLFEFLFSWSGIVPSVLGLEVGNKCKKRLIRSFLIGSTRISVDSKEAMVHDDLRLMFILLKVVGLQV